MQEISKMAFENCTSLPAIALSAGVESIGEEAFKGCTALQSVKSQSGVNKVKSIRKSAFSGCTSLSEMRFSNGLTYIGEYAFWGCSQLENVSLPEKVTILEEYAFGNSGLKTLTVSWTTPLTIQANVFYGVDLSQCVLYVPKGCKDAYKSADVWKKFGNILEEGEEPVTTGTQKIGDLYYSLRADRTAKVIYNADYKSFSGALTIPATVTYDKQSYTVTDMPSTIFMNCTKLTEVTFPNTITEIPQSAFFGCTALTKVTFPTTLTKIEESAFYQCEALASIDFPLTLTEIGPAAFQMCHALTAVSIPANVTSLPDNCFAGCTSLASVTLNEGLQSIGHHCFNKAALKTIVLPSSLTSLAKSVFYNCNKLESIHVLRETPPTADENAFDSSPVTTCILYVPAGTHDTYANATGWKNFTKIREKGVNERIKYGDLYYQLNEDLTANVTYETDGVNNYKDLSGEITIEKKVWYQGSEYTVVAIEPNALQNCTGITKVNLPTTIDIIYGGAFKNCTNLEEINIPSALTHLDHYAFNGTKLFNDNKDEDGAVYYDGCLIYYPLNSKDGMTYEVKPGTRLLASYVFSGDVKLTGLILPEGLKCICNWALDQMQRLETLSLPSSLYYIEKGFCNNFKAIKSLYNYNPKPLNLSKVEKHFDGLNKSLCTLYVPKGAKTAYGAAEEWKDFPIVEMKGVYTVTFEDYNGYTLKTESVSEGEDAHAPADPEREGYNFTGWDKTFTNVLADLTVTAQYQRKTFTVVFKDGETDGTIDSQNIEYGMSATEPEVPDHEDIGLVFEGWDYDFDIIMENTVVTALYEVSKFTVTFLGLNDEVIAEKVVEWDKTAETPDDPEVEGYVFLGWEGDYSHVKADVTVTARLEKMTFYVTFYDRKGGIIADREVAWDEAYNLVADPDDKKDFGPKALDCLLEELGKESTDMIIILAGYPDEMEKMLKSNKGLQSRFPYTFHFEDYSEEELLEIAVRTAQNSGYSFSEEALNRVKKLIHREIKRSSGREQKHFGNARFVTRLISTQVIPNMSRRVLADESGETSPQFLSRIEAVDIPSSGSNTDYTIDETLIAGTLRQMNELVGREDVKQILRNLVSIARSIQQNGEDLQDTIPLQWTFTGSTGTGKSSVAKLLAQLLHAFHLISSDRMTQLRMPQTQSNAWTSLDIDQILRDTMKQFGQGLLFIDLDDVANCHIDVRWLRCKLTSLTAEMPGSYAFDIAVDDHRLPAQPIDMPLSTSVIHFADYTADELMAILLRRLEKQGCALSEEAAHDLSTHIRTLCDDRSSGLANARTIRHIYTALTSAAALRTMQSNASDSPMEITKEDVQSFRWKPVGSNRIGFGA